MFITAILGRITPSLRMVELSSAGHCQPFRVTADGKAELLNVENSPPLGILGGLKCHLTSTILSPGEWLVFYTDGLTESFSPEDELLGSAGVRHLLSEARFGSPNDIVAKLREGEAVHRGKATPQDDLTILAFGFR
jgi:serine phosphatase RsbU (regulator of sigma subunit)